MYSRFKDPLNHRQQFTILVFVYRVTKDSVVAIDRHDVALLKSIKTDCPKINTIYYSVLQCQVRSVSEIYYCTRNSVLLSFMATVTNVTCCKTCRELMSAEQQLLKAGEILRLDMLYSATLQATKDSNLTSSD